MTTITITGDERARLSTTTFGWWESLDDWALYSDFPARGQKIAEIVLEAQEYRWRALDGAGGIFGAGGSATLEDAKANAERVCRARGTMPAKMGERVEEPKAHAASGARPITREDEGRVREALAPIFMGDRDRPALQYDRGRLVAIAGEHYSAGLVSARNEFAARAGIVPGPEGWCWAAPACDACRQEHDNGRTFTDHTCALELKIKREPARPPAWLTAAVLAALPVDGTPVERNSAFHTAIDAAAFNAGAEWTLGTLDAALDAMTASGEIEYVGDGRWRRWGVPEGWVWCEVIGSSAFSLMRGDMLCAQVRPNGEWGASAPFKRGTMPKDATAINGRATPPTLAAARAAALRACWERGVFGTRPALVEAAAGPVDALSLLARAIVSPDAAERQQALAAWGATLVEQARTPCHAIETIGEQSGTVTARRIHGEGGEVVCEERVAAGDETLRPAWAVMQARAVAAERAAAEARLDAEAAERRAANAEAELARVVAGIDAVMANVAKGAAK